MNGDARGKLLLHLGVDIDVELGCHPEREDDSEIHTLPLEATSLAFAVHGQFEVAAPSDADGLGDFPLDVLESSSFGTVTDRTERGPEIGEAGRLGEL